MIAIDSAKVKGEPGTGYEAPEGRGPFNCGNCRYFRASDSTCGQATMIKVSALPKIDGRKKVDAEGCCEYVVRIGSAKWEAFKAAAAARR